jgi:hypothetical protein
MSNVCEIPCSPLYLFVQISKSLIKLHTYTYEVFYDATLKTAILFTAALGPLEVAQH